MATEFLSPPPRDFTDARGLDPDSMVQTIRDGRPNTAMKPFRDILSAGEIEAVARYVYDAFARCRSVPAAYHTVANGWVDHRQRYEAAYPFVLGEVPADRPDSLLTETQRRGRELYRRACVICHEKDRMRNTDDRTPHQDHPDDAAAAHVMPAAIGVARSDVSAASSPGMMVAASDKTAEGYGYGAGAGPHDGPREIPDLTPFEDRGEHLYLDNCAYCHAGDGTGMNWIGTFLQPHPPDFTDPAFTEGYTEASMRKAILNGLPQTSMPAFGSVLDHDQVAAIIAYMNRAFLAR